MVLDSARRQIDDHGGSLGRARRLFPSANAPWIDLSTGINPHSWPVPELAAGAFARLPEPERELELRRTAMLAYGAPSIDHVAAAPGTQILLPRVMALVSRGKARVLGPTYAEHARAAALMGHAVEETADFDALADSNLAVVVNPNNPDGRVIAKSRLLTLARHMAAKGGLLIVDEAFMEVGPSSESVAAEADQAGLVVLRSFGKFYGLAGVRLGFALGEPALVSRLAAEFGPWAVSGPTLEIGIRALSDTVWRSDMQRRLRLEAGRLDALLTQTVAAPCGGTDLYRFLRTSDADRLFKTLGEAAILVRNFSWDSTVLRFGLPATEVEWRRVEDALTIRGRNRSGS